MIHWAIACPHCCRKRPARRCRLRWKRKGAKFHFGPLVTAVNKAEKGVLVSLNNGETIAADLVVSAVGVRPRTDLAKASGLQPIAALSPTACWRPVRPMSMPWVIAPRSMAMCWFMLRR